jgi:prevent-host-death family protein
MEERPIGATELRQKLTDVIQAIKEEKVAYVVETFGRPQVVVISLDEYRRLQNSQSDSVTTLKLAREAFGMWRDREDIDDEWLTRVREPWYSKWNEPETDDE